MTTQLVIIAAICMLCVVAGKFTNKIGVPALLIFILLGIVFGSEGIFRISFDNYHFAEQISTIALIFIMFYGGFCTNWAMAKPVAVKAGLLASFGVVITAFLTGTFCVYVFNTGWLKGLLIGSVIASTDAASVFSILRTKKLNLSGGSASLLEIESGSNDPTAYTMTTIILGLMAGNDLKSIPIVLASQLIFGLAFGAAIGVLGSKLLSRYNFRENGFQSILVVSFALLSYSLPVLLNGNGFLSVYITGIILGNSTIRSKSELVHFFDGITGIMQMLLFFMLGLLTFPSKMVPVIVPAIGIALFMTFISRPIAVGLLLIPFKVSLRQQLLICWSGLRGAASIVFAILTVIHPAYGQDDIFHIVFFIALLSVSIQGSLLPWVSKKLNMIDDDNSILKTFNDYQQEKSINLMEAHISPDHPWVGEKLSDIQLPTGMLAVMIRRDDKELVPNGDTLIKDEDTLVLTCTKFHEPSSLNLVEIEITNRHPWVHLSLKEITLPQNLLIVMIKRKGNFITPSGSTIIKKHDILMVCGSEPEVLLDMVDIS